MNQLDNLERVHFEKGISVIIPIHNGMKYIENLIQNLNELEINEARFEVIFVLNGKFQDTYQYLLNHYDEMEFDQLILISDRAGASEARNLGKQYVKYSHTTFLDVDDLLSSNYIEESYQLIKNDTILVSQIHDLLEDGTIIENNRVNKPILENCNQSYTLSNLHAILGITTCKFIPSHYLELIDFNTTLLSGEDTVFYCKLYAACNPNIEVIHPDKQVVYYRLLNAQSISRGRFSYDFNVAQRLDILDILDKLLETNLTKRVKRFIQSKYNAQTGFITRFLQQFPEKKTEIIRLLELKNYQHLNQYFINVGLAKELVIAYCFPPFMDTSGIVMAKRIAKDDKIVDIFSNDMSKNRNKDYKLKNICVDKIDSHKMSHSPVSFSNFNAMSQFIDEAFLFYMSNKDKYESLYSRALFPASHFPPLFIKLHNPNIKWVAEFSDPLLLDIKSNERYSEIIDYDMLIESLKQEPKFEPFIPYMDYNLFNLAELIPFAFADELLFTNEFQLNSMMKRFSEDIQQLIKEKSKINMHPIPDETLYEQKKHQYHLNDSSINVGYFGNFYETRSLDMLLDMVDQLMAQFHLDIHFHIFTSMNQLKQHEMERANTYSNVFINHNLPYLEFLNLSKEMDLLLLFDAQTKGYKEVNPYLPSKLSDYIGTQKAILAIVEEGSILASKEIKNLNKISYDDLESNQFIQIFNQISADIDRDIKEYDPESNETKVKSEQFELIYSLDLEINQKGSSYILKPHLPITDEKDLTMKIKNTTDSFQEVNIQTKYDDPQGILRVLSNKEEWHNVSIREFRSGVDILLSPDESFIFELKYNKSYDKESFKKAGTVIVKSTNEQVKFQDTIEVK
nr:glycosyltransferase [Mammaliicoccus sp. Marseille-Q6498]